jgi:hypothetical protein
MDAYELAVDAIMNGRIHAKLSKMVDYYEELLNVDEGNE